MILSRAPARALAEAIAAGMKKTPVEVAVAYDGTCVTDAASLADTEHGGARSTSPESPASPASELQPSTPESPLF